MGYWRNDGGISSWNDRRGWSYLDFDGSGDYVTISDNSTLDITGNITIATWFMLGAVGANQELINKLESGVSSGYRLMSSSSNKLQGDVKGDGSGSDSSSTSLVVGTWYHGAMTWDGSSVQVYLNGSADGSPTSYSGTLLANNQPLYLGARYGSGNYLTGGIAQTGIWNIALTASQIESMFNEGLTSTWTTNYSTGLQAYLKHDSASSLTDLSSNTNTGTVTNATLNDGNDGTPSGSPESIVVREALNTDKDGLGFPLKNTDKNVLNLHDHLAGAATGSGGMYVNVGSSKTLDDIFHGGGTIMAWVYPNSSGGGTAGRILNKMVSAGWDLYVNAGNVTGVKLNFETIMSGTDGAWASSARVILWNTWNHVAITHDSIAAGDPIMYIDASVVGTSDVTTSGTYTSDASLDLIVGNRPAGTKGWNGLIDEVFIYNRTLSPAEITKNYKHGKGKHS